MTLTKNIHSASGYNFKAILFFNLLGFVTYFSWYLPAEHGYWGQLDTAIFYYFNQLIGHNIDFANFVAIINNRAFDIVSLFAMGSLFLYFFMQQDMVGKRRVFFMGVVMLLTAVVISQLGRYLPGSRPSPTSTFTDVFHVSELTGIPTKDRSANSFPGDHGMMLLIFSGFILRYFTRKGFVVALVIMMLFSLPRIIIGAHWFSDIYAGAFAIVCVVLSWFLYTPASDYTIDAINRFFSGKYQPLKTQ